MLYKSLSMLLDIDTRIVDTLSEAEKEKFNTQLHKLTDTISLIKEEIAPDESDETPATEKFPQNKMFIAQRHTDEPYVFCKENKAITNLNFPLLFSAVKCTERQRDRVNAVVYFAGEEFKELSSPQEISVAVGEITKVNFSLNDSASSLQDCYLIIKSANDGDNEAQQILKFNIKIAFNVDCDF